MSKIKLSETFIKDRVKLALTEDLYPYGDITSNLINNKKIIYCEWPLCLNSAEASTISNLYNEFKLKHTVVGTQGRFSPSISFFRDLLNENIIGHTSLDKLLNPLKSYKKTATGNN